MEMLKPQRTQPLNVRNNQVAASRPGAVSWKAFAMGSRCWLAHTDQVQGKPWRPEGLQHLPHEFGVPRTAGTQVWQCHIQLSYRASTPISGAPSRAPAFSLRPPHPMSSLSFWPLLGPAGQGMDSRRTPPPPITRLSLAGQESIKTGVWKGNVTPGYYTT